MQQERNADLIATKRKVLLERLVNEVSRQGFDLYYAPSSQVATYLLNYAKQDGRLNANELALLEGLTRRDIEIILSLKDT